MVRAAGCILTVGAAGCTLTVGAAGCTLTAGAAGRGLVGAGGVLGLCPRSSHYALHLPALIYGLFCGNKNNFPPQNNPTGST
jgi:hypothetical protein